MSGYLVLKPGSSTGPAYNSADAKRWFSLHRDFVLYTFRSEGERHALTATPMPGYTVLQGHELKGDSSVAERDREKIIKMFFQPKQQPVSGGAVSAVSAAQLRKVYYFAGNSVEEVQR